MLSTDYLYSHLADDPDLAELSDLFAEELPAKLERIVAALRDSDVELLNRLVHQLKGAAGSYGFDPVSAKAGGIERRLRSQPTLDGVGAEIDELVQLAGRVRPGTPPTTDF